MFSYGCDKRCSRVYTSSVIISLIRRPTLMAGIFSFLTNSRQDLRQLRPVSFCEANRLRQSKRARERCWWAKMGLMARLLAKLVAFIQVVGLNLEGLPELTLWLMFFDYDCRIQMSVVSQMVVTVSMNYFMCVRRFGRKLLLRRLIATEMYCHSSPMCCAMVGGLEMTGPISYNQRLLFWEIVSKLKKRT